MPQQGKKEWIAPRKTDFLFLLSFSFGCLYLQSSLQQIPQCTCGDCHWGIHNDSWFLDRFNSSYHPLMTRNTSNVIMETFNWWKRLQPKCGEWDEYKNATSEVFRIIPDKEMYRDAGPERCRVCSVVGNSGNLINSRYGPMIDDGDFVLRMNRGPTQGFQQDVGSKTTHRVIYPVSAIDMDHSTRMVFFPFKIADLKWLASVFGSHNVKRGNLPVKKVIKANVNLVMVVSPHFMKYVHYQWLKKHGLYPSTGFMTLILALHICDKVRVFGFGPDRQGYWHHYFEKLRPQQKTGHHGGTFEYATLKELHKRKKVELYG